MYTLNISFSGELTLHSQENTLQIQDNRPQLDSRYLLISPDTIMITGGTPLDPNGAQSLLLTVSTTSIETLSNLKTPRFWHATCFIDNKPAVLGGAINYESHKTNEVEIYDGNQ